MIRMSVAEAARVLSVSPSTVRRRIARGEQRALKEIVDGRSRVWVVFETTAEPPDSVAQEHSRAQEHSSDGVDRIDAEPQREPAVLAEWTRPETATKHERRVIPPESWVVGWALRDPKTFDWVAPSSAGDPQFTARLNDARLHRTRALARTYARWLPVTVEPTEVAVGGDHRHIDEVVRRSAS